MHIDVIADGLGFTEGPVWLPDDRVALTSISHGCVYIVDPRDGALERIDTGGGPNGLACSADGTLYVAQNGGAWGASGTAEPGVQVITGSHVDYLVEGLGAPNDLTFGPDGRRVVTGSNDNPVRPRALNGPPARPDACGSPTPARSLTSALPTRGCPATSTRPTLTRVIPEWSSATDRCSSMGWALTAMVRDCL
jgi:hypothetical protein